MTMMDKLISTRWGDLNPNQILDNYATREKYKNVSLSSFKQLYIILYGEI